MMPKINTGLFLTLSFLLSRRADAGLNDWNPGTSHLTQILSRVCCQDNTWDLAVAEQPQKPLDDFSLKAITHHHPGEGGLDFQTVGLLLNPSGQEQINLSFSPFARARISGDFSPPAFHPPKA